MRIKPGDVVRHFKRELNPVGEEHMYFVWSIMTTEDTGEKIVIYSPLSFPDARYCRTYDNFMSEVDHSKYPNIRQKYRFEKVRGNEYD